jgi:hypothetical protein
VSDITLNETPRRLVLQSARNGPTVGRLALNVR